MGYIVALIALIIVVPLFFLLCSRRTTGGGVASRDHGLSPSEPSSDQPTPPPGRDRGVPPG